MGCAGWFIQNRIEPVMANPPRRLVVLLAWISMVE